MTREYGLGNFEDLYRETHPRSLPEHAGVYFDRALRDATRRSEISELLQGVPGFDLTGLRSEPRKSGRNLDDELLL